MLFGIEIFDMSTKGSVYTFILKILINISLGQDPLFIAIPVVNNPERVKYKLKFSVLWSRWTGLKTVGLHIGVWSLPLKKYESNVCEFSNRDGTSCQPPSPMQRFCLAWAWTGLQRLIIIYKCFGYYLRPVFTNCYILN